MEYKQQWDRFYKHIQVPTCIKNNKSMKNYLSSNRNKNLTKQIFIRSDSIRKYFMISGYQQI